MRSEITAFQMDHIAYIGGDLLLLFIMKCAFISYSSNITRIIREFSFPLNWDVIQNESIYFNFRIKFQHECLF